MRYGLKLEDVLAAADSWLCPHCQEEDHPEEVYSNPALPSMPAGVATLPDFTSMLDTQLAFKNLLLLR